MNPGVNQQVFSGSFFLKYRTKQKLEHHPKTLGIFFDKNSKDVPIPITEILCSVLHCKFSWNIVENNFLLT